MSERITASSWSTDHSTGHRNHVSLACPALPVLACLYPLQAEAQWVATAQISCARSHPTKLTGPSMSLTATGCYALVSVTTLSEFAFTHCRPKPNGSLLPEFLRTDTELSCY
jgi:hypothetical protein